MESLTSRTFFLCLLLFLLFTATKGQQSQCDDRWFGDKCQYQCHCLNDAVCDKVTGDCPGSCDKRWFGPQCQYLDAAYNSRFYLTDGSGTSKCIVGDAVYQDFTMLKDVMFTWMRIVTNRPGQMDRVNITFLSSSGAEVAQKSPLTRIYLSDTILDIYGELQDRFKTIRLNFDTPETRQSFCSMQVSSGRNVAIKQTASQSSTWGDGVGEKAVDGKSTQRWDEGSCSSTNDTIPYWTLNLSLPVTVNVYTIVGRHDEGYTCIPLYFQLETYFNSSEVQKYKMIDEEDQNYIYDVYPVDTSPITSVTLSVSKEFRSGSPSYCSTKGGKPAVTFCEMQIYGDVVCQKGKWGRKCEKACNCHNATDSCFVSTGMCQSGCKAGFHGPGCREECDPGFHGSNCNQTCPENCLNNTCDSANGACTQCVAGYQGPMCDHDCSPGFFGLGCANQCSKHCGGDGFCHNINGSCLSGCKPGYRSDNCEQPCIHTTYGEGCNKRCSVNCVVNATHEPAICEHVYGQCLHGCLFGYSGITCEEISSDPDDLNLASIIVPVLLGLIVVAALIFGICFWRRRKAYQGGKEAAVDHEEMKRTDEHGVQPELKNQPSNRQNTVNEPNDNYEQISLHCNEEIPDSNEHENVGIYMNEENPDSNEYDKISPYSNEEKPELHNYETMRTSMNMVSPPVNQNEYEDIGANIGEKE